MKQGIEFFQKTSSKLNNEVRDVDNKISENGDFEEIVGVSVIIKTIIKLLALMKGTYIFDPELGVGIQRFIFEQMDDGTLQDINRRVKEAVTRYEGRAKIEYEIIKITGGKGLCINFKIYYDGLIKSYKLNLTDNIFGNYDDSFDSYLDQNFTFVG